MGEFTISRDGVELAGEEAGEGVPVVLLHGLTATRRYVVMGSRSLERSGHRVITYDARGHGRSSPAPVPEAYTYSDLGEDLLAVLDDRGIERAVLAGASMGAHTLLWVALHAPERVAGVVVIRRRMTRPFSSTRPGCSDGTLWPKGSSAAGSRASLPHRGDPTFPRPGRRRCSR